MPVETKIQTNDGDLQLYAGGGGRVLGALQRVAFDVVASLADGVAITSVQATLYPSPGQKFRIRGVYGTCATKTGAVTFDVYDTEGTPASVLSAAVTVATAGTLAAGVVAKESKVYAAGYPLTLRATTAASTGALTNLRGFVEIETYPS